MEEENVTADNENNSSKCNDSLMFYRKCFEYISCIVCLVIISVYGIKGIFKHLVISIIFSFFFILYLISFCYFDVFLAKSTKIVLTESDLTNPSFFGLPIRSVTYSLPSDDIEREHHHYSHRTPSVIPHSHCTYSSSSSSSRGQSSCHESICRAHGGPAPPTTLDIDPPSYQEALLLPPNPAEIQYHEECETPPPPFELVIAQSSGKDFQIA